MRQEFFNLELSTNGQSLYEFTSKLINGSRIMNLIMELSI